MINKIDEKLSADEWGQLYNKSQARSLAEQVKSESVSVWSKEMLKLTQAGDKVLEIGCGTGMTSLYLSKHGRQVTAIDYSQACLELVRAVSEVTGYEVECRLIDATKMLPFEDGYFDMAFWSISLEKSG